MATPAANPSSEGITVTNLVDRSRITTLAALAGAIALVAAVLMWARTPDYRVLFANLSDRDTGSIVQALQQMNVPYKLAESGGAVLVPGSQVHDVRMRLTSQGLPHSGNVGFELLENQKFGITQFQEQVNYQRGLEGELARSIQSLDAVQAARVHLAIPKTSSFLREQQKPTASVLITLNPGHALERTQVAGIVHLVAASVIDLAPKDVSVVDQNGTLLSSQGDGDTAHLDPGQLAYVQQVEGALAHRINEILEPVLGRPNFRAQVHAEVDFTESEQTAESYKPNRNAADAAVRSEQTGESASSGGTLGPQGIPGALSNQPPTPTQAPITGTPATPAAGADAGVKNPSATQRNNIVNYEVDKTVKYTRGPVGLVKRLSAAIVVNNKHTPDGKEQGEPLSDKDIENVTALAKEAMGFRDERGDSIKVTNTPFSVETVEAAPELPLWKQPEVIATALQVGKYLLAVLVIAYLFFTLVRPALRHLMTVRLAPEPGMASAAAITATAVEAGMDPNDVTAALKEPGRLEAAREIARQNPKLVANLVRTWVNNG
jgi:flagellar M-ring protein FliF